VTSVRKNNSYYYKLELSALRDDISLTLNGIYLLHLLEHLSSGNRTKSYDKKLKEDIQEIFIRCLLKLESPLDYD
jgi:hypothetical protein